MLGPAIVVAGLVSLGLYAWKEKPRVRRVDLQAGGRYRFTLRLHRTVFPGVPMAPFTASEVQLASQLMQGTPQSLAVQQEPNGDALVRVETIIAQDDVAEIGVPYAIGDVSVTLESVERV